LLTHGRADPADGQRVEAGDRQRQRAVGEGAVEDQIEVVEPVLETRDADRDR
jgi:hypothetical protein